jgi:asparagine N-glycosylation enzyme membrane subunit Stt3
VTGGGLAEGVSVGFLVVPVELEISDDFFSMGFVGADVDDGSRTDCFSLLFVFVDGLAIDVLTGFFGIIVVVVVFLGVITVSFGAVIGLKKKENSLMKE